MKQKCNRISKILVASLLSVVLCFGCWTAQQWFDLVSALLPIIGQTYLQFYGFAQGGAPDAGDVAKVQALSTAGQDAIKQVEALIAAQKAGGPSVAGQVNAVLAQLQQSVTAFLSDAQIKNSAKFAQYSGFAQAILADIQDVIALIPVMTPATAGHGAKASVGVSYSKAKNLPGVFQERLSKLPK
jgi:hypothetical protein